MDFETLLVETSGTIGRITLNRPESLNAMSYQLLKELTRAAELMNEQTEVRVVIISGNGRAFCAGADLHDSVERRQTQADGTWLARREAGYVGSKMAQAVEGIHATTIIQLHGHVIGGGVVLTSCCDLRVAAEGTLFAIPEVDLGIPLTWGGIPRLVRDIGPIRTKELVMTCRRFDAAEAREIGFINTVVAADELENHVNALAKELAEKPSVPIAITKAHVNAIANASIAATSFADGDLLVNTQITPESETAAMTYAQKALGKSK